MTLGSDPNWQQVVLQAMQVPRMPRVFELGTFERRVTLYSQQVRALNLVEALVTTSRLKDDGHMAVVGAGVAGLTFAAGVLRRTKARVTLLEKEDRPLSLFRYDPNRWLHPRVYDWPQEGWDQDTACLPVLDWKAERVAKVREQMEAGWDQIVREVEGQKRLNVVYNARDITLQAGAEAATKPWVSWNAASPDDASFDLVILAVGFGLEHSTVPGFRSYWHPDGLDDVGGFRKGVDPRKKCLVSGSGDGALTDLLRLCLLDFRHEAMVREFVSDPRILPIQEEINRIERDPAAQDRADPQKLHDLYKNLDAPHVVALLKSRLRQDTEVFLNAERPTFLSHESSALNRFLVSQLRRAGGFKFLPGRLGTVTQAGNKLCVEIVGQNPREFDFVVPRHGPRPRALEEFPLVWKACESRAESWKHAPNLLDQTRQRYWSLGAFGRETRDQASSSPTETQAAPRPRTWVANWFHVLEPAQHFQGREALRKELGAWLAKAGDPNRMVSVCAIGGTGKTALVERVLRDWLARMEQENTPLPGGVFVWSFYENDRVDDFLGEACRYLTGEAGEIGGRSVRLSAALKDGLPHLLVLDGLETVQAEGGIEGVKGGILDSGFRALMRQITARLLGKTRMLVTSRFPLCDVAGFDGNGAWQVALEDLDPLAAREALRAWGVHGDDATLDALAEKVGHHALSVRVMGAFLKNYAGGDGAAGLSLDLGVMVQDASDTDKKAVKLDRLLGHLSEKMPDAEREIMARLSVFHRGIGVDLLVTLVEAGGQIAGMLVGKNEQMLLRVLRKLAEQGLVFSYNKDQRLVYTAHPFLRDHFKKRLGVRPEEVHEVVRQKLAPSLDKRPGAPPQDADTLDRYEELIEYTRLAGKVAEAFELYRYGMGGFENLGIQLGEYRRGKRILERFSPDGSLGHCAIELSAQDRGALVNDWGFFVRNLGDLVFAKRCSEAAVAIYLGESKPGEPSKLSIAIRNLAEVEWKQGGLLAAEEHAASALRWAEKAGDSNAIKHSHAILAFTTLLTGKISHARQHFIEATRLEHGPLHSARGIREAEFRLRIGDSAGALELSLQNLEFCEHQGWTGSIARLHALLGHLTLPDTGRSRHHLNESRSFATRTGQLEITLRAHILAATIARHENMPLIADAEASQGLHLADSHGFGLLAIDLLLALSRASLALSRPNDALKHAQTALDRSTAPECGYAWGEADALHLLGLAHRDLGERDAARHRFSHAATIRTRIEHPEAQDSRAQAAALSDAEQSSPAQR